MTISRLFKNLNVFLNLFPANNGQSQFRFDNECNISLPENHKRVSETAPKLDAPQIEPVSLEPNNLPIDTESESKPPPLEPASQEDKSSEEVVVKEDSTPRGRRLADEAREVAAAHASLLVDIEACKRVSMPRRPPYISSYLWLFVLLYCFSCVLVR